MRRVTLSAVVVLRSNSSRRCALRTLSSEKDRDTFYQINQGMVSMLNSTAKMFGVKHRLSVSSSTGKISSTNSDNAHFEERKAKSSSDRPRRLQSALRYMTQEDIEAYVARLVDTSGGLLEGLPAKHSAGIERFIYSHCVKILLCLMHETLDRTNGTQMLGLTMSLQDQAARGKLDLLGSLERRLDDKSTTSIKVDVRAVSSFVDRVVEAEQRQFFGLERMLHYNVSKIVLNLVADACSTFRFDFFGHSLRLQLEPNDALSAVTVDRLRAHRKLGPSVFDDKLIELLVDEILSDKDINLWLVPDSLERTFYQRFFSFYGTLLDYALSEVRFSLLDVNARLSFKRDKE